MIKRRLAVIAVSATLGLGFALHERSVEARGLHVGQLSLVAGATPR